MTFRFDIPVKDPVLWDIYKPELYRVAVTVMQGTCSILTDMKPISVSEH